LYTCCQFKKNAIKTINLLQLAKRGNFHQFSTVFGTNLLPEPGQSEHPFIFQSAAGESGGGATGAQQWRNRGATVAYLLRYAIVLALVRSTPDLGKLQGLDVCADDGAVQFQLLFDHLDVHGRDRVRKRRVYHPDCTRMYTHIFCD